MLYDVNEKNGFSQIIKGFQFWCNNPHVAKIIVYLILLVL